VSAVVKAFVAKQLAWAKANKVALSVGAVLGLLLAKVL